MVNQQDSGRCLSSQAAEEWRPVVGYEGHYEVSSLGRVRSHYRGGRILSARGRDETGYAVVSLTKDGKRHTYTLHRLVCRAFHGEPSSVWSEAGHMDGQKTNNCAENLVWVTKAENEHHKIAHGTRVRGERSNLAKLTDAAVAMIKRRLLDGGLVRDIASEFGASCNAVTKIKNGKNWRHIAPAEAAANAGDWIQWSGGECPVSPEAVVDYVCADETTDDYYSDPVAARLLDWKHEGGTWDIIAYRVVQQEPGK